MDSESDSVCNEGLVGCRCLLQRHEANNRSLKITMNNSLASLIESWDGTDEDDVYASIIHDSTEVRSK